MALDLGAAMRPQYKSSRLFKSWWTRNSTASVIMTQNMKILPRKAVPSFTAFSRTNLPPPRNCVEIDWKKMGKVASDIPHRFCGCFEGAYFWNPQENFWNPPNKGPVTLATIRVVTKLPANLRTLPESWRNFQAIPTSVSSFFLVFLSSYEGREKVSNFGFCTPKWRSGHGVAHDV